MSEGAEIEKIDLDKVDWRGPREFFESLGEALDKLDDKDEAYDFTWVGKRKAIIEAGAPINKTFRPDVENSKNWDTTENLFIEGDNLDALKLLQESYLGKVKMIYIDPPYNTGKDFVYHDNFKASTEQYDEDTEYKDESGNIQFKKNEKTNGRYHSDWLSMMYPRLKLAKNLLETEGVIFISIGEDELHNITLVCNEIFGEDNHITTISRLMKSGGNKGQFFSPNIDYILVYARDISSISSFRVPLEQSYVDKIYNKTENGRRYREMGLFQSGLDTRPNQRYWIECPDGELVIPPGTTFPENTPNALVRPNRDDGVWRWSLETFKKALEEGNIEFKKTTKSSLLNQKKEQAGWNIYTKIWLDDRLEEGRVPTNFITEFENRHSSKELKELSIPFDFAKPSGLISYLIKICGATGDDIIVDFFSGSGTTAHAVMSINALTGSKLRHIQVQLPEDTIENSEEKAAGFNTIPEISRERIRRAGDKIASEHPDAKVDFGFRSLVIDDTNYKEVYKAAGQFEQSALLDVVDNVKEDRGDLDLLYGVLTQSALELNRPIEERDIAGSKAYLYDYFGEVSGLVACFSESVSEDTIKQIAGLKPLTAVFRESSFTDSQAKVNLAEHFRIISPDTKVKVI